MAKMQVIAVVCDNCKKPIEDENDFGKVVAYRPDGITAHGEWCADCLTKLPLSSQRKRQYANRIPGAMGIRKALAMRQENKEALDEFLQYNKR